MADGRSKSLGPNEHLIGVSGSRARLSTPALILELDPFERNIAAMAAFAKAAHVGLRPHSKGAKSVEIARRQIAAGAIGVCCATLHEAEVMAAADIRGILITSETTAPPMIERLMLLSHRANGLMLVVDDPVNVAVLGAAAANAKRPLALVVDFEVGQGRTGVTSIDAAVALAAAIESSPYLRFAGVQAYYGHMQHISAVADRMAAVAFQVARIRTLVARLNAMGLSPRIVTGGGTGTFDLDLGAGVFTEIQPGSYLFIDREYDEIERDGDSPFHAALFVQASVTSSREGFAVVNAGYKAFATEGVAPIVVRPELVNGRYMWTGDEHGAVRYDVGIRALELGDVVEFLTSHCDPTINLYDQYHCVRGDTLVDIWSVDARGY